ncbi:MAG: M64 family metallopeptidase [Saprospiraceae bacterium]
MDTLQYSGVPDRYINLVILGDGYTLNQLDTFAQDARQLSEYLLTQKPFVNYKKYFNIFAIRVISNESGAKHPNTASDCQGLTSIYPITNPDTYFSCSFDIGNIHRLIVPLKSNKIGDILFKQMPLYDQIFIISNSPYYGGSGGSYACSTVHAASKEVTAHEIGHSFAGLSDEYYAGDGYARESANMTMTTNPDSVRWKNWLNIDGIGIYQHCCGGNSALWYKPHLSCKMQALNNPFCNVCMQSIVVKIHQLTNSIVQYEPKELSITDPSIDTLTFKLTELMRPEPNTLKLVWNLNGKTIFKQKDSILILKSKLVLGNNNISLSLTDTTSFIKIDNYEVTTLELVNWFIKKTISRTEVISSRNEIILSLYSNPVSNVLSFSIEPKKEVKLGTIQIMDLEGRIYLINRMNLLITEKFEQQLDISNLPIGIYKLVMEIDKTNQALSFIKK